MGTELSDASLFLKKRMGAAKELLNIKRLSAPVAVAFINNSRDTRHYAKMRDIDKFINVDNDEGGFSPVWCYCHSE